MVDASNRGDWVDSCDLSNVSGSAAVPVHFLRSRFGLELSNVQLAAPT
jgi:hypothetical protein